jgi:signal transduction histidine kinase/CheY-like chemotaxis protein
LNHGQYTFLASASNGDGVWNNEGLKIQLTIRPAYWQTLWFKSLLCLVFISIAYTLFKNRQHRLILQRQKVLAEQSAEYKTQFLANVSHEIRTPMNAIVGLSKLSLETNLDNKQTEYIGAIQESSQNLLTIINDLLDHTKLEAGKFSFIEKPFNLKKLTDQLNSTFKHSAKEKQLEFDIIVDENIDRRIIGDQLRLNQILINLIGNAIKFTKEGKVWLKVKILKDLNKHIHIRFEVGDTGIGIPKDKIDYIFESFNQSEEGVMKGMEGTGLGLSIAKQLVEKQNGELYIESKIGQGTRLWFDLIFEKTELKKEIQAQNKTSTQIEQLNILVVEDTYFNQLLVVEILKKHIKSPEIIVAENGKIALELLSNQSFDIILMDVKMPVMDGFEATKIIRNSENDKIRNIPILAVTASAVPEQLIKCKDAGMNDYVTKPIDDKDLLKKIFQFTQNINL